MADVCEVCGREKMPPCPHQSVEAGSMRCLSCGKNIVGNPPVFEQAPAPANPCRRGHYADDAIYAAECYRLGYARERAARQAAEESLEAMKDRDYEPIKKWIQEHAPEAVQRAYKIMAKAEAERDEELRKKRHVSGLLKAALARATAAEAKLQLAEEALGRIAPDVVSAGGCADIARAALLALRAQPKEGA